MIAELLIQLTTLTHTVSGLQLWQWRCAARQQAHEQAQSASALSTDQDRSNLELELDRLLYEVAGLDRLALRLDTYKDKPEIKLVLSFTTLNQIWQQRLVERVPLQYLLGNASWRNFNLTVSPAVLIPRPETEDLIDLAIAAVAHPSSQIAQALQQGHWADLGTGSGAIALGLAQAFPQATIHAVDCSPAALTVAQDNAAQQHLSDRIHFYQGAWLAPLDAFRDSLSGIIANPPYIPRHLLLDLQPEVAWHEPHLALDGGVDGLDCIRQIIATAPRYLQTGGILLLEMMAGQAASVEALLEQDGSYRDLQIHADLAGIERFALAYKA